MILHVLKHGCVCLFDIAYPQQHPRHFLHFKRPPSGRAIAKNNNKQTKIKKKKKTQRLRTHSSTTRRCWGSNAHRTVTSTISQLTHLFPTRLYGWQDETPQTLPSLPYPTIRLTRWDPPNSPISSLPDCTADKMRPPKLSHLFPTRLYGWQDETPQTHPSLPYPTVRLTRWDPPNSPISSLPDYTADKMRPPKLSHLFPTRLYGWQDETPQTLPSLPYPTIRLTRWDPPNSPISSLPDYTADKMRPPKLSHLFPTRLYGWQDETPQTHSSLPYPTVWLTRWDPPNSPISSLPDYTADKMRPPKLTHLFSTRLYGWQDETPQTLPSLPYPTIRLTRWDPPNSPISSLPDYTADKMRPPKLSHLFPTRLYGWQDETPQTLPSLPYPTIRLTKWDPPKLTHLFPTRLYGWQNETPQTHPSLPYPTIRLTRWDPPNSPISSLPDYTADKMRPPQTLPSLPYPTVRLTRWDPPNSPISSLPDYTADKMRPPKLSHLFPTRLYGWQDETPQTLPSLPYPTIRLTRWDPPNSPISSLPDYTADKMRPPKLSHLFPTRLYGWQDETPQTLPSLPYPTIRLTRWDPPNSPISSLPDYTADKMRPPKLSHLFPTRLYGWHDETPQTLPSLPYPTVRLTRWDPPNSPISSLPDCTADMMRPPKLSHLFPTRLYGWQDETPQTLPSLPYPTVWLTWWDPPNSPISSLPDCMADMMRPPKLTHLFPTRLYGWHDETPQTLPSLPYPTVWLTWWDPPNSPISSLPDCMADMMRPPKLSHLFPTRLYGWQDETPQTHPSLPYPTVRLTRWDPPNSPISSLPDYTADKMRPPKLSHLFPTRLYGWQDETPQTLPSLPYPTIWLTRWAPQTLPSLPYPTVRLTRWDPPNSPISSLPDYTADKMRPPKLTHLFPTRLYGWQDETPQTLPSLPYPTIRLTRWDPPNSPISSLPDYTADKMRPPKLSHLFPTRLYGWQDETPQTLPSLPYPTIRLTRWDPPNSPISSLPDCTADKMRPPKLTHLFPTRLYGWQDETPQTLPSLPYPTIRLTRWDPPNSPISSLPDYTADKMRPPKLSHLFPTRLYGWQDETPQTLPSLPYPTIRLTRWDPPNSPISSLPDYTADKMRPPKLSHLFPTRLYGWQDETPQTLPSLPYPTIRLTRWDPPNSPISSLPDCTADKMRPPKLSHLFPTRLYGWQDETPQTLPSLPYPTVRLTRWDPPNSPISSLPDCMADKMRPPKLSHLFPTRLYGWQDETPQTLPSLPYPTIRLTRWDPPNSPISSLPDYMADKMRPPKLSHLFPTRLYGWQDETPQTLPSLPYPTVRLTRWDPPNSPISSLPDYTADKMRPPKLSHLFPTRLYGWQDETPQTLPSLPYPTIWLTRWDPPNSPISSLPDYTADKMRPPKLTHLFPTRLYGWQDETPQTLPSLPYPTIRLTRWDPPNSPISSLPDYTADKMRPPKLSHLFPTRLYGWQDETPQTLPSLPYPTIRLTRWDPPNSLISSLPDYTADKMRPPKLTHLFPTRLYGWQDETPQTHPSLPYPTIRLTRWDPPNSLISSLPDYTADKMRPPKLSHLFPTRLYGWQDETPQTHPSLPYPTIRLTRWDPPNSLISSLPDYTADKMRPPQTHPSLPYPTIRLTRWDPPKLSHLFPTRLYGWQDETPQTHSSLPYPTVWLTRWDPPNSPISSLPDYTADKMRPPKLSHLFPTRLYGWQDETPQTLPSLPYPTVWLTRWDPPNSPISSLPDYTADKMRPPKLTHLFPTRLYGWQDETPQTHPSLPYPTIRLTRWDPPNSPISSLPDCMADKMRPPKLSHLFPTRLYGWQDETPQTHPSLPYPTIRLTRWDPPNSPISSLPDYTADKMRPPKLSHLFPTRLYGWQDETPQTLPSLPYPTIRLTRWDPPNSPISSLPDYTADKMRPPKLSHLFPTRLYGWQDETPQTLPSLPYPTVRLTRWDPPNSPISSLPDCTADKMRPPKLTHLFPTRLYGWQDETPQTLPSLPYPTVWLTRWDPPNSPISSLPDYTADKMRPPKLTDLFPTRLYGWQDETPQTLPSLPYPTIRLTRWDPPNSPISSLPDCMADKMRPPKLSHLFPTRLYGWQDETPQTLPSLPYPTIRLTRWNPPNSPISSLPDYTADKMRPPKLSHLFPTRLYGWQDETPQTLPKSNINLRPRL